jgi:hypothetical protein
MKKDFEKNIQKLLEISSDSINRKSKIFNINTINIMALLKNKNGFYTFKSALHIFSIEEQEVINNIVKKSNLYKAECFYFAEDIFGNLFCIKNNKFYLMDLESGSYEYIADNLDGWAKEILNDYNYLTGYPLADEWQKINQPLKNNERLVPKKSFLLGGEYEINNLYTMDRIEALSLRFDIFNQLKDISDGDSIILTTG